MKSLRSPRHLHLLAELRKFRVAAGITQATLAKRLNHPQSYIAKVERAERRLDVIEFVAWVEALDVVDRAQTLLKQLAEIDDGKPEN